MGKVWNTRSSESHISWLWQHARVTKHGHPVSHSEGRCHQPHGLRLHGLSPAESFCLQPWGDHPASAPAARAFPTLSFHPEHHTKCLRGKKDLLKTCCFFHAEAETAIIWFSLVLLAWNMP